MAQPPAPLHPASCREYSPRRAEQSVLYQVVRDQIENFVARAHEAGRVVPRFVERELRRYLECGILAHGFVRLSCTECRIDRLVPFSCKGRGFCPSCGGRRMAETAAFLIEHVIPTVPVRQWVLSVPVALRYRMAFDAELTTRVLRIFIQSVFASCRKRARSLRAVCEPQPGAITFVQRFGDALNLNIHFHTLVLDGVYEGCSERPTQFVALPPPGDEEVARVTARTVRGLRRLLERRGLAPDDGADQTGPVALADPLTVEQPLLAELTAASVRGRIAMGPSAGQHVLRVGTATEQHAKPKQDGRRCASMAGVSIHADVALPAHARHKIERLCRYAARPPLASQRLSRMSDGRLLYRLKRRWRDGTEAIVFEPLELVEKLAALVPPPRFHMVRYHGVLAPRARNRSRITPGAESGGGPARTHVPPADPAAPLPSSGQPRPQPAARPQQAPSRATKPPSPPAHCDTRRPAQHPTQTDGNQSGSTARRRLTWPELMQRVFAIDVLRCAHCGACLLYTSPSPRDKRQSRMPSSA